MDIKPQEILLDLLLVFQVILHLLDFLPIVLHFINLGLRSRLRLPDEIPHVIIKDLRLRYGSKSGLKTLKMDLEGRLYIGLPKSAPKAIWSRNVRTCMYVRYRQVDKLGIGWSPRQMRPSHPSHIRTPKYYPPMHLVSPQFCRVHLLFGEENPDARNHNFRLDFFDCVNM